MSSASSKKRMFALATALMAAVLLTSGVAMMTPGQEDLSADVPDGYIPVTNTADLARVGTGVTYGGYTWSLTASYFQTKDITLTGTNNHTPIGSMPGYFGGTYDGGGFKISGMRFTASNSTETNQYYGLFGGINKATIRNVNITNATIDVTHSKESTSSNISYGLVVGALAGYAVNSTIERCSVSNSSVKATMTGTGQAVSIIYLGGLMGSGSASTFTDCFVASTTISNVNSLTSNKMQYSAGLVGLGGSIETSHAYGMTVSTSTAGVGTRLMSAVALYATQQNTYYAQCNVSDANATKLTVPISMTDYAGFDFASTWMMGANYPVFLVGEPELVIYSVQGDERIAVGTPFLYEVLTTAPSTISVSGANWLSVSGNTISGTPTAEGVFNVTVTATGTDSSQATQTFTITIVPALVFGSSPAAGYIVVG